MRDDAAHLLDMLVSARKVQKFCADLMWETFSQSELHQSAVIRELQIIGEAARLVSQDGKTRYTFIRWNEIAGMRNRIIHEYFRIRLQTVWQIVQEDIPELTTHLEQILSAQNLDELDQPNEDNP
jgi:uncharacterized protein with HEPN domain